MIDRKVYSEVYAVILALGIEYIENTPAEFMEFIVGERNPNYTPEVDQNKALNEQGFAEETVTMIAMLKLNYWCNTDEEKAKLLRFLEENEEKLQQQMEASTSTRDLLRMLRRK